MSSDISNSWYVFTKKDSFNVFSTFIHSNVHDTTAIDCFFIPKYFILEIKKLEIGANVSDHHPIKMVLQNRHYLKQQKSFNRISKSKIKLDKIKIKHTTHALRKECRLEVAKN